MISVGRKVICFFLENICASRRVCFKKAYQHQEPYDAEVRSPIVLIATNQQSGDEAFDEQNMPNHVDELNGERIDE